MPTQQEIVDFYAANANNPEAIQAAMAQYGVSPEQAAAATGESAQTFTDYAHYIDPSSAAGVKGTVQPGGNQWNVNHNTDLIVGGPTGYMLSNADLEKWFKDNPNPAQWAAEAARRGMTLEEASAAIMKGTEGAYDTKSVTDYINSSPQYGYQDTGRIMYGYGAKNDANQNGQLEFNNGGLGFGTLTGPGGSPAPMTPGQAPQGPLTATSGYPQQPAGGAAQAGGPVQPGQTTGSGYSGPAQSAFNWGAQPAQQFNTPVLDALYATQQQRMTSKAPTFNFQDKPGALTQAVQG